MTSEQMVEKVTTEVPEDQRTHVFFNKEKPFSFDSIKKTDVLSLKITECDLESLSGFPIFEKLKTLDLSLNKISGGLVELVKSCPNLETLVLKSNPINCLSELECLASLKNLKTLDVSDCPVSTDSDFSSKIFSILPKLKYMDHVTARVMSDSDNSTIPCSASNETHSSGEYDVDTNDDEESTDDEGESEIGLEALAGDDLDDDDDETDIDFHVNQSIIEAIERKDRQELAEIVIDDEDISGLNQSTGAAQVDEKNESIVAEEKVSVISEVDTGKTDDSAEPTNKLDESNTEDVKASDSSPSSRKRKAAETHDA